MTTVTAKGDDRVPPPKPGVVYGERVPHGEGPDEGARGDVVEPVRVSGGP